MPATTTTAPTRRILACVSGMSPAIVTETLFALVTQQDFIPDEVHVITTLKGRDRIRTDLLNPDTGPFHAFVREYLPGRSIRFDDDTIHLIGAKDGNTRKDITTDDDNRAAANTLYRVLRELKSVPGTHLHASVAGGRKSMSFYMGQAFSLVAESQDRLSHVLVSDPFENPALQFFYPPRTPRDFSAADKQTGQTTLVANSANAHVQLADLSVIKLRSMLGEMPARAQRDFDFAIRLAQATLEPPKVRMVWSTIQQEGRVEMLGETVKMAPQEFLVLGLYALARLHEHELPAGAALRLEEGDEGLGEVFLHELSGENLEDLDEPRKTFKPVHSKILTRLRAQVGGASEWLTIESTGKPPARCEHRRCALRLPADRLEMVGFDTKWWPLLRAALVSAG
jgi:CRISPR-associated protein (TIGR02584 family)